MYRRSGVSGRLTSIIFEQKHISRQNFSRLSGVDVRTVSAFVGELVRRNLVAISRQSSGRGRPAQIYTLLEKNVRTVHFTVTPDEIYTVVCDIRGFPVFFARRENAGWTNNGEMLVNSLKLLAQEVMKRPELCALPAAAGVGAFLREYLPNNVRQRISDQLQEIFKCPVPVYSTDAFLLSQYLLNHSISGQAVGISYQNDILCSAVNGAYIDENLRSKAEKIIASAGMKNMGFANFIREFHREMLPGLSGFFPDDYYNVLCTRAGNSEAGAEDILREFGGMIGELFCRISAVCPVEKLVLLHPRPVVSAGVEEVLAKNGCHTDFLTANFSSNEFILAPAGYLRRELIGFEHGRLLNE